MVLEVRVCLLPLLCLLPPVCMQATSWVMAGPRKCCQRRASRDSEALVVLTRLE